MQDQGVPEYEKQARLSRFQGSQAISSSDYFGREDGGGSHGGGGGGAGGGANGADFDVTASELMNKLSFQVRPYYEHSEWKGITRRLSRRREVGVIALLDNLCPRL